ncbi:hypothetical protein ABIC09_004948 [Bradyrhizobium sp. S3.12.5]|uniref:hypothetical protein n=1 Tax=Bradyrhizobium sp. S3.12.5 TaxID=3156386 RepID=UPI0033999D2D
MLKKTLVTFSLLLPLTALSAAARAGATISDTRYWPSEARQSAQSKTVSPQSDLNSAFAYDRGTSSLQPAMSTNDATSAWHYQGGPKSR